MKKLLITSAVGASILFGGTAASAYNVQKGDTLSGIAKKHGTTLENIIAENPQIKNPNLIFPNQSIEIPNGTGQTVSVNAENTTNTEAHVAATSQEVDLLSRLIEAEAGNESYAGKVAVGEVIMNRIASPRFPNDMYSVIYAKGQFTPAMNGTINNKADDDSIQAAKEAIAQGGNPNGAMFFYAPQYVSGSTAAWFESLQTAKVIGNHVFKY